MQRILYISQCQFESDNFYFFEICQNVLALNIFFNLTKLKYFFIIPIAILSNKIEFGTREKMPKLSARGARVPGEEKTF